MQFNGKKGLILGVANDHSIAWAIAKQIMEAGGECGFTHLPDREDDERQRNRRRVAQLTDKYENAKFLDPHGCPERMKTSNAYLNIPPSSSGK